MTASVRRAVTLAVVTALAVGTALTVQAEDTLGVHHVNTLIYENEGGYVACVDLRWKNPDIKVISKLDGVGYAANGHRVIVDLENPKNNQVKPEEGAEVWLVISIENGDRESCRKVDSRFYYQEDGGTTAIFRTSGTTLNKNRCKLVYSE